MSMTPISHLLPPPPPPPPPPRLSYREQIKERDEEADRGNDGKTTSKSGLALNGISYHGKLRIARSGGSWL